jgi:hypothetical protein
MMPPVPPPEPQEPPKSSQSDAGSKPSQAVAVPESVRKSRRLLLRAMRCPSCRRRDIEEAASSSLATFAVSIFFVLLLVGLLLAIFRNSAGGTFDGAGWWYIGGDSYTHRCRSCGTTWNINKARNDYGGCVIGLIVLGVVIFVGVFVALAR